MFETLVSPQIRDTLATDALMLRDDSVDNNADDAYDDAVGREEHLTDDVRAAFSRCIPGRVVVPRKAKHITQVQHKGVSYTVRGRHEGNSGIFVKSLKGPFSINNIVVLPDLGPWLVVHRHCRANVIFDPYLEYPYLRASLWATQLENTVEVVPISDIDTHFAKCAISWEDKTVAVVVSLSRVRSLVFATIFTNLIHRSY